MDAKSGATKLERGSGFIKSRAYKARLDQLGALQLADQDGWIEAHKNTKAKAIEQNNELAYTLFFDSRAAAHAEEGNSMFGKAKVNASS